MPDKASVNVKKNICYAAVSGCLIGLFVTVGYVVKHEHGFSFSVGWLCAWLIVSAVATAFLTAIYTFWDKSAHSVAVASVSEPLPNRLFKKSWIYFLVTAAVLLIIWLPALLAFYPGIYAYDAAWQHDMFAAGEVTEHHPVIHTYLVGWLTETIYQHTGKFNKGIFAYTLVQELIMACGCGFIFYELHRRKEPTWIHALALVMFVVYPPFVIFVFTSTKDSLFAMAVADLVLLLLGSFEDAKAFWNKKSNRVLFVVFLLEVVILRNNSIYAFIPTLPFLAVSYCKNKEVRSTAVGTLALAIVLFLIYKYPITKAVTVEGISKSEKLSVPCQQIMRIYNYRGDELAAEDKALIEHFFDDKKYAGYFNPYIADATKGSLIEAAVGEEFDSFKSLWLKLFKEYPGEYVDSFLENTYGFWYPWPTYVLHSMGGEGYTIITVMQPGVANTKLPGLLEFYRLFENSKVVMGYDVISWLFAPATFLYIAIAMAMYLLKSKKRALSIPFIYLGLLWLTYLLGPVATVRYSLYFYALVPVWPAYIRSKAVR